VSRFNPKIAGGALLALAAVYMVVSLATGRSARAEVPPDLSAALSDAGLDVWKGAAFLVQNDGAVAVDVRPTDAFARYHLPGAVSRPGASVAQLETIAAQHPALLVYAGKDEVAQKLVAEARPALPAARVHYLVDGARAWYLAFQLPVPLFAEASPPDGYPEALAAVKSWFETPVPRTRAVAMEALQTLARQNYQPGLLKSGKKPVASGAKKKIGGGCG
jgi:rhodanese-related sulfurtransferase